jgi:hypothetical protein
MWVQESLQPLEMEEIQKEFTFQKIMDDPCLLAFEKSCLYNKVRDARSRPR